MLWPYAPVAIRRAPARLDGWLPPAARRLEHHGLDLDCAPEAALAAIRDVRLREMPIVGALFTLRGLPHHGDRSLAELFGTAPFLILDEEPGRELVFGVAASLRRGRRGRVPARPPRTPDEFRAAVAEGWMAAVGNFRVEPRGAGSRLWTETWVAAPGLAQAVPFTAYWLAIGPFSAWIRRMFLRAARRRVMERAAR